MKVRFRIGKTLVIFTLSLSLFSFCYIASAVTSYNSKVNQLSRRLVRQETLLKKQSSELQNLKRQISDVKRASLSRNHSVANSALKHTSLLGWEYGPVSARISGQINMAAMGSDDGYSRDLFFVTNSASNNRLNLTTTIQHSPDFSIGNIIEFGFKVNPSSNVSQTNKSGTNSTDFRKFDIVFNSKKAGKVSLGKGDTASNGTAESDLSGTTVSAYSSIDHNGSGLFFRNNNEVPGAVFTGNPTIGDAFNSLDGLSRQTRVRYDTLTYYGFSFATSYMTDYVYDFALRYLNTFPWFKTQAAIAYTSSHSTISSSTGTMKGNRIDGSVSVLFNCGFNVTYAAGKFWTGTDARQNPYFHFIKLGYILSLISAGKTAFSVNYNIHRHFNVNTDKGESYGAELVQNFTRYNTELYAGWQKFRLDRINNHYKPINIILVGARYKFG